MTCLAAFKILLYGYTRQADLRVATLVANRTRQEMEALIGFVVNALIIRTDLHGNPTCREVIQRVRATTLAAYTQQDLPFEELVRTLERECNLQRASLCQVMVIWQNFMLRPLQDSAPTLTFQVLEQSAGIPDGGLTTFDLTLILRERPQGLTATCIYKTDLFDTPTIRQMLDDFQSVLTCLSAKPEQALVTCLAVALQEVRR
jgi:non-ribosomal peptide synthetase component F